MNTMMMKLGLGLAMVLTMAGCAAEAGDEEVTQDEQVAAPTVVHQGGEAPVENAPSHRDMPMLAAPKDRLPVERGSEASEGYQPKIPTPGDPGMAAF